MRQTTTDDVQAAYARCFGGSIFKKLVARMALERWARHRDEDVSAAASQALEWLERRGARI
ncbi:MAG: hypothetical protein VW405_10955 [Rhodospirillaceae bacterium]